MRFLLDSPHQHIPPVEILCSVCGVTTWGAVTAGRAQWLLLAAIAAGNNSMLEIRHGGWLRRINLGTIRVPIHASNLGQFSWNLKPSMADWSNVFVAYIIDSRCVELSQKAGGITDTAGKWPNITHIEGASLSKPKLVLEHSTHRWGNYCPTVCDVMSPTSLLGHNPTYYLHTVHPLCDVGHRWENIYTICVSPYYTRAEKGAKPHNWPQEIQEQ